MRNQLILLPGWAFGPAALQPLCDALTELAPTLDVVIEPLPQTAAADAWLDELGQRLAHDSWLAGWSLGGMLATQLAARRIDTCRGLITIASNPCFRARPQWPEAMATDIFDAFHEAFQLDPEETLKRFRSLCSRGGFDPRTLARQLQVSQSQLPPEVLDAGLQLLAQLDGRGALHGYFGPQLHIFAERDALVPVAAAAALRTWMPGVTTEVMNDASHALPLERADDVAAAMVAFMNGTGA
ncbi:alpha/beta fold hydrolase [Stutzerimonas sp. VN223-3]|uniref:alpha/beta fold hydrolase n=1 Tax=Stutzerimonas sp. VN223-3 TaxID=3384601 RepID=UPI0038B61C24